MMEDDDGKLWDDGFEMVPLSEIDDDDEHYRISEKGIRAIQGWMRFQAQMCELEHGDPAECDDPNHQVAFLMAFVLTPWLEIFHIHDDEEV